MSESQPGQSAAPERNQRRRQDERKLRSEVDHEGGERKVVKSLKSVLFLGSCLAAVGFLGLSGDGHAS